MDTFVIRRNIKSQKIIKSVKPIKFKKLMKLKKKLNQKLKKKPQKPQKPQKSQKSMFIQMVHVPIMGNQMLEQDLAFGLVKMIPGITTNLSQARKQIIEPNSLLLSVLYLF